MDPNVDCIINAGTDEASDVLEDLRQIPREFYDRLRERCYQGHAFLHDLSFEDAFA